MWSVLGVFGSSAVTTAAPPPSVEPLSTGRFNRLCKLFLASGCAGWILALSLFSAVSNYPDITSAFMMFVVVDAKQNRVGPSSLMED